MRVKSPCEILQDASLVVYYPFDNTITDHGPNSIVGTLSSSGTSYVSGYNGSDALQLNSTGAYYQIPSLTALGISNQAFSIALWVKPTAVSGPLVHVSSAANGNSSFFAIYAFYISYRFWKLVYTVSRIFIKWSNNCKCSHFINYNCFCEWSCYTNSSVLDTYCSDMVCDKWFTALYKWLFVCQCFQCYQLLGFWSSKLSDTRNSFEWHIMSGWINSKYRSIYWCH